MLSSLSNGASEIRPTRTRSPSNSPRPFRSASLGSTTAGAVSRCIASDSTVVDVRDDSSANEIVEVAREQPRVHVANLYAHGVQSARGPRALDLRAPRLFEQLGERELAFARHTTQEERSQRVQRVARVLGHTKHLGPLGIRQQLDVVSTKPHPEHAFPPVPRARGGDVVNAGSTFVCQREAHDRARRVVHRHAVHSPIEIGRRAHPNAARDET